MDMPQARSLLPDELNEGYRPSLMRRFGSTFAFVKKFLQCAGCTILAVYLIPM